MSLDELQAAARSHSTSKIRDRQDLYQIRSLGFRGEALHSLARLSQLEICSRSIEHSEGWKITYDLTGDPIQSEAVAIAPGTVVTVSQLFGNWLSRRQSLPSAAQQLRAVQLMVQHLALCHPQLTWQVEQGDRLWFAIAPSPSVRNILPQFLRDVEPEDLQEIRRLGQPVLTDSLEQFDENSLAKVSIDADRQLNLLLGLPDRCHRHRPDWIKIAVNGRVVRIPELEQTILRALRRTLPRDRYPVCFLHLHLCPDQIDWNRHPAKAELYLRSLDTIQAWVSEAIAEGLRLSSTQLPESETTRRVRQVITMAEASGQYGSTSESSEPEELEMGLQLSQELSKGQASPLSRTTLPQLSPLKALAQVHQMYILVEHPAGIWLVEQHIAHERVLYEQLCDRWQIVELEVPVVLNRLTIMQVEQLQRIGLTIEPFGEQTWAARTAPEAIAQRTDCSDALIELSQGGDLDTALVATACRTAIRNGTVLDLTEMQQLLNQWQQTRNPRTCPHGRPIYLSLEESSLSRFFRRHWVIGKSHGI
jgi:DNA mismatch repair protein MutL